jgi:ABC-type Fe3+-hydroxamate transport system substrate-binding protein
MYISSSHILPDKPCRIISLVPSQTELLFDLGLDDEVVGITKFCIHPKKWFTEKCRIGGTKDLRIKKIIALDPDLIIANKEENVKEQVDALAIHLPVFVSDVNNYVEALQMIKTVGRLTEKTIEADYIVDAIETGFTLSASFENLTIPAAYFIWKDPWMAAGGDTFISSMMQKAGFENVFKEITRYPFFDPENFPVTIPEVIFLSSEPYPFKEKHKQHLQKIFPRSKIILVDGEIFSWYGSRLMKAPDYFKKLHDELHAF